MENFRILGFAGSLRHGSYNRSLLKAAAELVPQGVTMDIFDLEGIPPFNQDLENSMPAKVQEFKTKIWAADAILFVTPEHNYSIPGILKNAIDWASRPHGDNSFDNKAAAIMSASTGMLGGVKAQYHLRQVFVFLNIHPINKPDVLVTFAKDKFDLNGKLIDNTTREIIKNQLEALKNWTLKLK